VLNSENSSVNEHTTNKVRVTVGRGSSIFEVALLVHNSLGGNSGRGSSVGNTVAELVNRSGFVTTSQSQVVVSTVDSDMSIVGLGKEFHRFEDSVIASFLSGGLEREVGVAARTVPVALDRLRIKGNVNVEFFANSSQQISGNPELIAALETFNGTDLELPLTGEDFSVETRNLDTSSQAASHMSLSNISTNGIGGTNRTIVLALRISEPTSRETNRPSVRSALMLKKDVFLFKTEPGLFVNSFFKGFLSIVSKVGFSGGLEIRVISFAKNQISFFLSIGAFIMSERIRAEEDGLENNFGALSGSLSSGRTIIVPGREIFDLVTDLGDTHGL